MDQTLPPRLPANLESAVQRVRMAARSAAEHTVESLGLAALATTSVVAAQRGRALLPAGRRSRLTAWWPAGSR